MADSYGGHVNDALLRFMGRLSGTVVDVGCGRGSWAPGLRALGAEMLVGIEPSQDADAAAALYDVVLNGPFDEVDVPAADTLILADVLEHLADPWDALRSLRHGAKMGTELMVSVPNIQYGRAMITIARGDFPTSFAGGFWDHTHLHWFTARSLVRILEETGWRVERLLCDVGPGKRRLVNQATLGRLRPLLAHQLFARASATHC